MEINPNYSEIMSVLESLKIKCLKYLKDKKYVYKGTDKAIIVLKLLDDTQTNEHSFTVVNRNFARFRANKLLVVDIIDIMNPSLHLKEIRCPFCPEFLFSVGEIVEEPKFTLFETDKKNGIHYFTTVDGAFYYKMYKKNITERHVSFRCNGQIAASYECQFGGNITEQKYYSVDGIIVDGNYYDIGYYHDEKHHREMKTSDYLDEMFKQFVHVLANL